MKFFDKNEFFIYDETPIFTRDKIPAFIHIGIDFISVDNSRKPVLTLTSSELVTKEFYTEISYFEVLFNERYKNMLIDIVQDKNRLIRYSESLNHEDITRTLKYLMKEIEEIVNNF